MNNTNKIITTGSHSFIVKKDQSLELFLFPNDDTIQLDITLAEPGAELMLNGLFIASHKQNQIADITVRHSAPHTSSNQLLKAILQDESTVDIKGTIIIDKACDEAEAHLLNKNILLSEKAIVKSKPELQIDHDNVICTHGSATGQLDKEALFYLQSRGVPQEKARQILLESFIKEVIDDPSIQQEIVKRLPDLLQYA